MFRVASVIRLCFFALAVLLIAPVVNAATESFDEAYEISPGTRFEILNRDGSIDITGWDKSRIEVHAIKKTRWGGKLENVEINVLPGLEFRVETVHVVKNPKVSVSYDVKVPFNLIVKRIRTSNGEIELEGTHGDIEVETSNGAIEIEGSEGDIDASTSNGTIDIEDVKGYVSAHTSNGTIRVKRTTGVVVLETSNGSIETEVRGLKGNGLRIRTSNGAIELKFDAGLNADIEAKTSNGKIKLDDVEVLVKEISKSSLRGKIGTGGKKILCRTSNGTIVLKSLK